ncbi:MAG: hypothetical protein A2845_06100 [Candidatus Lloydbacteria bacterium RIFCSPHIGHO2_01_FULL_49_22]|uniref:IPT/TIG domain-containing protein n=1 Tax=Candidatus Lloydbacteria bacterium RIFCSPHIGHO2_01_FULL_49_22 TaxID=1798658 RepID=A0A1G2CZ24_9BACT|nr:MAG: hypothetical protein A2845_06100 [Candidatus Lloydbacteria bacterium RIFCSPHIGHO2_01_FULL_49_22]OGZ08816.1 MAG: hypothetical protein A3C14_01110 [Candidatus Lloydbacteria bacterium RIFCSPHIGHO2_02_FULL_50_18]
MRFTLKKILSVGSGLFVILVIVLYAYYQSRSIIAGPLISLSEPENNMTSTTSLIMVRGVATRAKEITLQGRQIFIDLDGRFAEQLLLSPGYNIIELTARDTQGRQMIKDLELVYQAPASGTGDTIIF